MKIKLEQGKHTENDRKIYIDTEGYLPITLLQKLFVVKLFKANEEWRWGNCDFFENAMKDVLLDTSFVDIAERYWKTKQPITEAKKLDELWETITTNGRKGEFKI